ncbi:hypothetical protein A3Q56_00908 [Intoshia linei]|uniref:E3 ubiquitin-protein ligase UBR5 ubiquitin-associated domain-containing protein n=1 Tax=Intoshia linei TaxID=1819745 RepID=A0A177BAX1_9BILA|nr:hypothetical protein A3Q56_00908 [Intoshia linei]
MSNINITFFDQSNRVYNSFVANNKKFEYAGNTNPDSFKYFLNKKIIKVVSGKDYIALLTQDGGICRIKFTVKEAIPLPSEKSVGMDSSYSNIYGPIVMNESISSPIENIRRPFRFRRLMPYRESLLDITVDRGNRTNASSISESIIDEVATILQGRNRDSIRRELRRSGLDVHVAINNLLSRNDEEEEPEENENFNNTVFINRKDKNSLIHFKEPVVSENVTFDKNINYIYFNDSDPNLVINDKFVSIAALYSELLILTEKGKLIQWKWDDKKPYTAIDGCFV